MLLNELKVGQAGKIISFTEDSAVAQRIEEMGVTRGETVEIIRYAPMGDPVEIKIRGYLLSLRLDEAKKIEVSIQE